jgi:hypothetical protein
MYDMESAGILSNHFVLQIMIRGIVVAISKSDVAD